LTKPQIWLDFSMHPDAMRLLQEGAEVSGPFAKLDAPEAWSALAQADGVVISARPPCDGVWMDRAPRLRVLARSGIGYDNVDVDAATARGICVLNTPDAPTEPTAEQAVTFILMLARRIKEGDRGLSAGRWMSRSELEGTEVLGKTLGVVGLGRIGGRVAEICSRGLRMRVIAYDPYIGDERFPAKGAQKVSSLDELLAQADFVSLHCPATAETRGMANRGFFARMKRGGFFVNVARGAVMVEADLLSALKSGHLAAAALDVFEREPTPSDNPLLCQPNLVLSPHSASNSVEGNRRMNLGAVTQALQVLGNERPQSLVNPEVWERRRR
jgi:D-3-phosphoglycerate dehydrogenase / 2-oxoglutarate reductase